MPSGESPSPTPAPLPPAEASPPPATAAADNRPSATRTGRFPRACTARTAARLRPPPPSPAADPRPSRREREERLAAARIVTPLVEPPPLGELTPLWSLRSMWQLASLLNFLHVFRPLLNIAIEFSAEELEAALVNPNSTLDDVHMPILKAWIYEYFPFTRPTHNVNYKLGDPLALRWANRSHAAGTPDRVLALREVLDNLQVHNAIPPVTRMALSRTTWVTILCRKLKDWWHWVADGDIPIVASHGAEVETYKTLEPGTRVLILKALCDIRVEQEDIRSYIEKSLKHGIQLSAFRRERIGGDSHGISYWYEDDPIIGHRLYREIRHVEVKKAKGRTLPSFPIVSYRWETVASNLDEFQEVSEKLFASKNRTEAALGKRLKIDILPEIDKLHKMKERALKKQHRQALLLDTFMSEDGLSSVRSLRDRKPVTYTFDDYDRSITEAIKITKRQNSPEHVVKKEVGSIPEASTNGECNGTSHTSQQVSDETEYPKSNEYEETEDEEQTDSPDRSLNTRNRRRRKRPQRYSEKDFIEAVSDYEAGFDTEDDIVGEAVYDEEYLRSRKQKKVSSSSEGDEEYRWEENAEEEEEEEEEEEDSLSTSDEDIDEPRKYKKPHLRSRRGTRPRSVGELKSGLRRSKRATRPRIDYRQYEISDTDTESEKSDKSNASDAISDASNDMELCTASQDSENHREDGEQVLKDEKMKDCPDEPVEKERCQSVEKNDENTGQGGGAKRRQFLDLNELAPGTGFEDGPNSIMKDEDNDKI